MVMPDISLLVTTFSRHSWPLQSTATSVMSMATFLFGKYPVGSGHAGFVPVPATALRPPNLFRRLCLSRLPQSCRVGFFPPPALVLQRLAHLFEFAQRGLVGAGKMQVEGFERADDRRSDHHPRKPFVVGRHHVPGRERRRSMPDDVLVDRHVSRPQRAFGDIVHRELPVLGRLLEPVEKPLTLFPFGDVEEELQDYRAVARQIALDRANIRKAVVPDILGHEPLWNLFPGKNFR